MVVNENYVSNVLLSQVGTDRYSYKKKIANNYEWARAKMDFFANQYNFYNERKEKFKVNYELFNGRMDFDSYLDTGRVISTELGVDIPEMEFNQSDYIHFPILQNVLNDLEGEEITQLKTTQQERYSIIEAFGTLEIQLQELEFRKQFLKNKYLELKQKEEILGKQLQEKYGDGTINVERGEFVSN